MKRIAAVVLCVAFMFSLTLSIRAEADKREEFESMLAIGDWFPAMETEEQVKRMAENGIEFTFVWGYDYNNEHSRNQVEWCGKYGIKCILMDTRLTVHKPSSGENIAALTPEEIYDIIEPNIDNPTVIGYNLWDEPWIYELPVAGKIAENFKKATDRLIPFINLFPPVVANGSYEAYMSDYFEYVGNNFVSFDIYPFSGGNTVQHDYYTALSTAASVAKRNNADFWLFIQSMSYAGHSQPTMEELRFQANSALAYGVDKLMHFCYRRPSNDGEFLTSVASVDTDGVTETELWPLTQQLNREIQFLSPRYSGYEYLGTYPVYAGQPLGHMVDRSIVEKYPAHLSIQTLETDQPLLVGVFDGAMMITNASVPAAGKTATVKLDLRYCSEATVTQSGQTSVYSEDEGGFITLTLESGEGAFLELEEHKTEDQLKTEALFDEYFSAVKWFESKNKNVFIEGTYEPLKAAIEAIKQSLSERLTYEEYLPLFTVLREARGNAMSVKEQYRSLTEVLFEQTKDLNRTLFSEASVEAYDLAASELQRMYDLNTEPEYPGYNRLFTAAYEETEAALKALEHVGVYGDINADGALSLVDAIMSFYICAGRRTFTVTERLIADLNGNGSVEASEALTLFRRVAGK